LGRFEDKTAVITGGGTGIGRATAELLAAEGAHVFITGRRQAELDATVRAIGEDSVTAITGDVSNAGDLDRLYDAVRERGRGLDVLFANAAAFVIVTLEESTDEDFDLVFGVNVRGTYLTVQKALPLLNEGASVILNASISKELGATGGTHYAASKAAVRSFARTWANELGERGIRVNALSPGMVDTAAVPAVFGDDGAQEARESEAASLPLGRIGRPEEIASVVAFLACEDSAFMTGADVQVDGGHNQI
jgi:NAD(P)-dependent dehydrogenase (short-subunit alcohol dehydrogenase family)